MRAKFSSDTDDSSLRVSFFNIPLCIGIHFLFTIEEEPKPVKLMLRALPLIQAHVRNILAPNMALEQPPPISNAHG
jgi:hypothetical protein